MEDSRFFTVTCVEWSFIENNHRSGFFVMSSMFKGLARFQQNVVWITCLFPTPMIRLAFVTHSVVSPWAYSGRGTFFFHLYPLDHGWQV